MVDESNDGPWGYVNDRGKWLAARKPEEPDCRVLEAGLNEAWADLLRRHMPFHEPSENERARLFDLLGEIEKPPITRSLIDKIKHGLRYFSLSFMIFYIVQFR